MTWSTEISQRYANAFYELVLDHKQVDIVLKDFEILSQILAKPSATYKHSHHDKSDFFRLLAGPLLTLEQKIGLIENIFQGQDSEGISEISINFLKFLLYKNRMAYMLEIITAFNARHDKQKGLIRGQVFTCQNLTADEKAQIEKVMTQRLKKQVYFEYHQRPSLLGGILVKAGGFLFDGSVANQLLILKEKLLEIHK